MAGLLRKFARGFSGSMAESMSLREKEAILIEREKRLNAQKHKEAAADRTFRSGESRLDRAARAREGLLDRAQREKDNLRDWEGGENKRAGERISLEEARKKQKQRQAAIDAIDADETLSAQEKGARKILIIEGRPETESMRAKAKSSSNRPVGGRWNKDESGAWVESGLSDAELEKLSQEDAKAQSRSEQESLGGEATPYNELLEMYRTGRGLPPRQGGLDKDKATLKHASILKDLGRDAFNEYMASLPSEEQMAVRKYMSR